MDINLGLRTHVLEQSLKVEDGLSRVMGLLLRITPDESRTLGATGSALSFITKAELLRDLSRISKAEYNDLKMFMELRNQLVHNMPVTSLLQAATNVGKVNNLIAHSEEYKKAFAVAEDNKAKERILFKAQADLFNRVIDLVGNLFNKISNEIKDEDKEKESSIQLSVMSKVMGFFSTAINSTSDEIDKGIKKLYPESKGIGIKKRIWGKFWSEFQKEYPEVIKDLKKDQEAKKQASRNTAG